MKIVEWTSDTWTFRNKKRPDLGKFFVLFVLPAVHFAFYISDLTVFCSFKNTLFEFLLCISILHIKSIRDGKVSKRFFSFLFHLSKKKQKKSWFFHKWSKRKMKTQRKLIGPVLQQYGVSLHFIAKFFRAFGGGGESKKNKCKNSLGNQSHFEQRDSRFFFSLNLKI